MNIQEFRLAVLHSVIQKRRDVGKTQLQKLVYFLQQGFDVPTRYAYKMHHYGPFAEALETDLVRLKLGGYINIQPDPNGYGFHITSNSVDDKEGPTTDDASEDWYELTQPYSKAINDAMTEFGRWSTSKLELAATIHFIDGLTAEASTDEVNAEVKGLKPKFSLEFIASCHLELATMKLIDD